MFQYAVRIVDIGDVGKVVLSLFRPDLGEQAIGNCSLYGDFGLSVNYSCQANIVIYQQRLNPSVNADSYLLALDGQTTLETITAAISKQNFEAPLMVVRVLKPEQEDEQQLSYDIATYCQSKGYGYFEIKLGDSQEKKVSVLQDICDWIVKNVQHIDALPVSGSLRALAEEASGLERLDLRDRVFPSYISTALTFIGDWISLGIVLLASLFITLGCLLFIAGFITLTFHCGGFFLFAAAMAASIPFTVQEIGCAAMFIGSILIGIGGLSFLFLYHSIEEEELFNISPFSASAL